MSTKWLLASFIGIALACPALCNDDDDLFKFNGKSLFDEDFGDEIASQTTTLFGLGIGLAIFLIILAIVCCCGVCVGIPVGVYCCIKKKKERDAAAQPGVAYSAVPNQANAPIQPV